MTRIVLFFPLLKSNLGANNQKREIICLERLFTWLYPGLLYLITTLLLTGPPASVMNVMRESLDSSTEGTVDNLGTGLSPIFHLWFNVVGNNACVGTQ